MPDQREVESGFSLRPWTGPQRLKPLVPKLSSASLKRCPDTNLFSMQHYEKGRDPKISPVTFCSQQPLVLVGCLDYGPGDRDLLRTARRAVGDKQCRSVRS